MLRESIYNINFGIKYPLACEKKNTVDNVLYAIYLLDLFNVIEI